MIEIQFSQQYIFDRDIVFTANIYMIGIQFSQQIYIIGIQFLQQNILDRDIVFTEIYI